MILLIMDDEKLIEHVRKYPELYDMTHQKYLDTKFKTSIWTLIGNELNETGEYIFYFILFIITCTLL